MGQCAEGLVLRREVDELIGEKNEWMFDLILAGRRERLRMLHHVVVFVFGLQHDQDLLQVVKVDVLRTLGGTRHADDAFSDVGQVGSLRLLHGPRAGKQPADACLSSDSGSPPGSRPNLQTFFSKAESKRGHEERKEEVRQNGVTGICQTA